MKNPNDHRITPAEQMIKLEHHFRNLYEALEPGKDSDWAWNSLLANNEGRIWDMREEVGQMQWIIDNRSRVAPTPEDPAVVQARIDSFNNWA